MAADSREIDSRIDLRDVSLAANTGYDIISTDEVNKSIDHMAFYQPETSVNGDEQANICTIERPEGGITKRANGGRAEQFLEKRGFGWLMETEEDELDSEKPLL